MRNRILVRNSVGKGLHRSPRCKWKDNIENEFPEIDRENVNWFELV
jgi:hypothetical protein